MNFNHFVLWLVLYNEIMQLYKEKPFFFICLLSGDLQWRRIECTWSETQYICRNSCLIKTTWNLDSLCLGKKRDFWVMKICYLIIHFLIFILLINVIQLKVYIYSLFGLSNCENVWVSLTINAIFCLAVVLTRTLFCIAEGWWFFMRFIIPLSLRNNVVFIICTDVLIHK